MPKLTALLPWLLALSGCMPPSWGAAALLHPSRKALTEAPPLPAESVEIAGDGVVLKGWLFRAAGERWGTIVYLHGSADNRASVVGVAKRYVPKGYDVLAYDSRAHGDSTGDACTYGYYEKRALARVAGRVPSASVRVPRAAAAPRPRDPDGGSGDNQASPTANSVPSSRIRRPTPLVTNEPQ
jgi:pimeloyl-ACP methyl ester carboxylesterase